MYPPKKPSPGLVLALGGGGARGFAHLGVLRVLEREKVPVSAVVGTSMGAIVGGLYAYTGSAEESISRLTTYVGSPEFRRIPFERLDPDEEGGGHVLAVLGRRIRESFVIAVGVHRTSTSEERFRDDPVRHLFSDGTIESFRIPFASVAVDLKSGQKIVSRTGCASDAICASSSVIGVFPPILRDGLWLADGDCACPVPVEVARENFGGPILAVPVPPDLDPNPARPTVLNVLVRQGRILERSLTEIQAREADLDIRPCVGALHWNEFQKIGFAISQGEQAAQAALPLIHRLVRRTRRPWKWIGLSSGRRVRPVKP